MPEFSLARGRRIAVLTVLFALQALAFHYFGRDEQAPPLASFADVPERLGPWMLTSETGMDPRVFDNLQPDAYLLRTYEDPARPEPVLFFTAYFQSQRYGHMPHSPRNCLPGSGWIASQAGLAPVPVSGEPAPIQVNRRVVQKGDEKSVVLYWYQTWNRVIASEYLARFYLAADAIRYNRTDTSLVRIIVPVVDGNLERASRGAVEFAGAVYPVIKARIAPYRHSGI